MSATLSFSTDPVTGFRVVTAVFPYGFQAGGNIGTPEFSVACATASGNARDRGFGNVFDSTGEPDQLIHAVEQYNARAAAAR